MDTAALLTQIESRTSRDDKNAEAVLGFNLALAWFQNHGLNILRSVQTIPLVSGTYIYDLASDFAQVTVSSDGVLQQPSISRGGSLSRLTHVASELAFTNADIMSMGGDPSGYKVFGFNSTTGRKTIYIGIPTPAAALNVYVPYVQAATKYVAATTAYESIVSKAYGAFADEAILKMGESMVWDSLEVYDKAELARKKSVYYGNKVVGLDDNSPEEIQSNLIM